MRRKDYFSKIDTMKAYKVEGIYCIQQEEKKEGIDSCKVILNVYHRVSGKPITNGTAFFSNVLKIEILNGQAIGNIPVGKYDIGITNLNSLPFSIKGLKLINKKLVVINCYLGNSLQF